MLGVVNFFMFSFIYSFSLFPLYPFLIIKRDIDKLSMGIFIWTYKFFKRIWSHINYTSRLTSFFLSKRYNNIAKQNIPYKCFHTNFFTHNIKRITLFILLNPGVFILVLQCFNNLKSKITTVVNKVIFKVYMTLKLFYLCRLNNMQLV